MVKLQYAVFPDESVNVYVTMVVALIYEPGESDFVTVTLLDKSNATGSIHVTCCPGDVITEFAGHSLTSGGVVSTVIN